MTALALLGAGCAVSHVTVQRTADAAADATGRAAGHALPIAVGVLAVLLFVHALISVALILRAWDRPELLRATAGPRQLHPPALSFTVLLPARDEEAVIGDTIASVWAADYPRELLEVVVICQRDDDATIGSAARTIGHIGSSDVRLVTYDDPPFNKPHALTVGLAASSADVVTVFDAEDDVHPDIFRVVNAVMLEENVGVVQGGVQLMNVRDHWFSVFNCLEYFFHFKSKLHFNASVGAVPLGGNTAFIRRELVDLVGGWDIRCLTEDADIGVRLSMMGERIRVIYDSRWVTREETPHSLAALVRQRTRWHQGFLHVLAKGDWRRIEGRRRRLVAVFTLAQPMLDAVLLVAVPLMPLALRYLKLPVPVAMLTFLPLYAVGFQLLVYMAGFTVFSQTFGLPVSWGVLARMPLTYLPYQWLLSFSALRATLRYIRGDAEWEKTDHLGTHRVPRVPVFEPSRRPDLRGFEKAPA